MEGEPGQLCEDAFDHEDTFEKEASMKKLCYTYLSQQAVVTPSNQHYQVRMGAGIGCTGSAEIADTKFWNLSERRFALCARVCQRLSILFYGRYRDDTCIIADAPLTVELQAQLVAEHKCGVLPRASGGRAGF